MALIVNGEIIAEDLITDEMERMRPRYEQVFADMDEDGREAQLRQWAQDNAIERVLINQEARRREEPVSPKEVEETYQQLMEQAGGEDEFYRQHDLTRADEGEVKADIEHHKRVEKLLETACDHLEEPTDEDIRAFYEEHKDDFMMPETVGVAHVVKHIDATTDPVAARKTLEQAKVELDAGADFAEVAEKYSDCPDNGGDLGHFPKGQMVEEFEHVIFTVPVDTVTDIFPTRFGFHIAKVYDHRPPAPQPLDEIRDQVADALRDDRRREAVEAFVDTLREQATIEETEEPDAVAPAAAEAEEAE